VTQKLIELCMCVCVCVCVGGYKRVQGFDAETDRALYVCVRVCVCRRLQEGTRL
jgi:hypothetical protein